MSDTLHDKAYEEQVAHQHVPGRAYDVADPALRADTDAIVRVTHTAICGADLLPYHGYTPGFELGTTLGHEFVGVIDEVGEAVRNLSVGDRAWRRNASG